MATLTVTTTLTYPDPIAADVRDTLCLEWGFSAELGLTKVQFIQQYLDQKNIEFNRDLIKNSYKSQKQKQLSNLDIS